MRWFAIVLLGSVTVWSCAAVKTPEHSMPVVTSPASAGWYAGQRVYYITTEITDPTMARNAGITYAPRLTDAIPDYPKPPEVRSVLERVYEFTSRDQEAVFASAPNPPGPTSADRAYSPLWLAYMVRWKDRAHARLLTSEEAILGAADQNHEIPSGDLKT